MDKQIGNIAIPVQVKDERTCRVKKAEIFKVDNKSVVKVVVRKNKNYDDPEGEAIWKDIFPPN